MRTNVILRAATVRKLRWNLMAFEQLGRGIEKKSKSKHSLKQHQLVCNPIQLLEHCSMPPPAHDIPANSVALCRHRCTCMLELLVIRMDVHVWQGVRQGSR